MRGFFYAAIHNYIEIIIIIKINETLTLFKRLFLLYYLYRFW